MFQLRKPGLFVSYRRSDTAGYSGRICEKLEHVFGKQRVFRDVEDILPGETFPQKIEKSLAASATLVVLIGPHWLSVTDASGARRLDQPDDFVRREIERGLQRGLKIIPILILGAKMPAAADLPPSIRTLCDSQALELSDERWDYDMGRLLQALGASQKRAASVWRERLVGVGIAGVALVGLLSVAAYYARREPDPGPGPRPPYPMHDIIPSGRAEPAQVDWNAPAENVVRELVRESLIDLDDALVSADFSDFYDSISWHWQQQISQQQLHMAFMPLMSSDVGAGDIESGRIAFRGPPGIGPDGVLMAVGVISTDTMRAEFDARYVNEEGEWRLIGLRVQLS
ncbi:MAG TPA: toll/interleukin-1 receptor domain-containing protein [Planctomycetota bacterium]|nr:toll/interleukin-1 receptor domain-containing protein [Planctomycetota bacterium]